MVSSYTKDFDITWKDPADAGLTWLYDPMHAPDPVCQAAGEFWDRMYEKYMSCRNTYVNRYAFSTQPTPRPPTPEILERGVLDVWTIDYLPEITSACARIRSKNYDAMSLPGLGDAIDGVMAEAVHAFGFTMKPITGFMGPTFGFVGFLEGELGPAAPQLAATMLQGFENGTAAAGAGLSELAEEAAKRPAVADALRRGQFDSLERVEGGAEFLSKFGAYLDEFGWRVDSWGVMERPTWAENPRMPLTLLSHYISDPDRSPRAAMARSVAQREEAIRHAESKLDEEKLPAFRSMLSAVQAHVPVSEGRALWQLIIIGSLRLPYLALGRKLEAAGALTSPDQIFYFSTEELRLAAHNPTADVGNTAASRQAEFAAARELKPPPFLGAPPDMAAMPAEIVPLMTLFFGIAQPEVHGREIKGQAASKGVVRARARVIRDLTEAENLQPGEVLVCKTTAPPWTPLFAIAAAVVTDSGGVLSHSAICAREYAIPCVVATQVATEMIPDGSMITVDGTNGLVRIET
ncbi:MAG: PEP-utilizing enzyme [Chloroflexota bacterium]|nr:PEP-utilizing enzyme [Chloroflexota bacterium]